MQCVNRKAQEHTMLFTFVHALPPKQKFYFQDKFLELISSQWLNFSVSTVALENFKEAHDATFFQECNLFISRCSANVSILRLLYRTEAIHCVKENLLNSSRMEITLIKAEV
jgi:hypothetical protein